MPKKVILGLLRLVMIVIFGSLGWLIYDDANKRHDERIMREKLAAEQGNGVVKMCLYSRTRCVGNAVLIGEQWAVSLAHVVSVDYRPYLRFANGEEIPVDAVYKPEADTYHESGDYPVLLHLRAKATVPGQRIASIGNSVSDRSRFIGLTRTEVAQNFSQIAPEATMQAIDADTATSLAEVEFKTDNGVSDIICAGDSGGGFFDQDNRLIALISAIEDSESRVEYLSNDKNYKCFSGSFAAINLIYYKEWILKTIQTSGF